ACPMAGRRGRRDSGTESQLVWKWHGNRRNPAKNRRLLVHNWSLRPIPLWTSARSSPHDFQKKRSGPLAKRDIGTAATAAKGREETHVTRERCSMKAREIDRRRFLGGTAAGLALAGTARMRPAFAAEKVVRIGFLAPLTGEVAAWGLPGLYGCEIWAEKVNAAGGVNIGGEPHRIEFVSYDDEYLPDKALQGAQKLVLEDDVKFIMMLGGDPWPGVQPFANRAKMLVSTLLPSDLSPDTPYLIAPAEVHPIYNVTGVEWLAENRPELKTVAICAQEDALGLPSVATYRAAFEAAGVEVVYDRLFDISTTDFAPVM